MANHKIQLRDGEHALLLVEGQVAGGEDGEHALLPVEDQVAGGEDGEQCAEVRPVLLSGLAEDPVII